MTASFVIFLEKRLANAIDMAKGERTRVRLRIAALHVLNERGYDAMTALSITTKAGLSEGLFYVYFKNKIDITLDLLKEFFASFTELDQKLVGDSEAFDAIRTANRQWLRIAVENVGLMRCIFQVGNEEPEFAALISRVNKEWYMRVLNSLERHQSPTQKTPGLLPLYMLGGMMDELARKLVVYPDPELIALVGQNGSDYDAVADAATVIWYRVLYPDDTVVPRVSAFAESLIRHI